MNDAPSTPHRRALDSHWAVLLAGPVIGTAYFLASYLLAEATCADELALLSPATLRTVLLAGAVVALAVFAVYARRAVRLAGADEEGSTELDRERRANQRFMIGTALLLLGMFAVFVLLLAVPGVSGALC